MKLHLAIDAAKAATNPKITEMLRELEQKGFFKDGHIDCDDSQDEEVKEICKSYGFNL